MLELVPAILADIPSKSQLFSKLNRKDKFILGVLSFAEKWRKNTRLADQLNKLRMAGAEHIELSPDLMELSPEVFTWWINQLKTLDQFKKSGFTYSLHVMQFLGTHPDSPVEIIRQASVESIREMVEAFQCLNPVSYPLHLLSGSFFNYLDFHTLDPMLDKELSSHFSRNFTGKLIRMAGRQIVRLSVDFIRDIITEGIAVENVLKSLKEIGSFVPLSKIGIENLEHQDLDKFEQIVRPLLKETEVSIVLDTGHLAIRSWLNDKRCFHKFIERYGPRMIEVHIHDVIPVASISYGSKRQDTVLQDHKPIGSGILNFKEILKLLKNNCREDLLVVVEDYYHDPVPSIKRIRQILQEI
ncbi:MAG: sugar phosphate isomerase/epimerase [Candidatus Yanofskybacteria bacterium]|nr:sugar phosphate isomerase/epimerase [Candidatus Yanofskybacteria bacterium]